MKKCLIGNTDKKDKMNDSTKILVISHNCFSETTANGRTLSTLFRRWNIQDLAQFYVHPEIPETKVCDNFYRLTDKEVLHRALCLTKDCGRIIAGRSGRPEVEKPIVESKGAYSAKGIKKLFPSLFYTLRDVLWNVGNYRNIKFEQWVEEFKPDIVLLQPGDYSFIYQIARKIAKTRKIPLVIYNSEDYFLKNRFSMSPLYHFQRFAFKSSVRRTFNDAALVIYSNDLLEKNLHKYFNGKSTVLLTSSEIQPSEVKLKFPPRRFLYAGNLGHERWKSLLEIAKEAKLIDENITVDIYSANLPKEAKPFFKIENGINFRGSVSYTEVTKAIKKTDVVIHTEGFSHFTKWDIRHGFSTKIADLLASGKCFLMYGPQEVACVDYLIENQAAWVATDADQLKHVLHQIMLVEGESNKYLDAAANLVAQRHNLEKNCRIFNALMTEVRKSN